MEREMNKGQMNFKPAAFHDASASAIFRDLFDQIRPNPTKSELKKLASIRVIRVKVLLSLSQSVLSVSTRSQRSVLNLLRINECQPMPAAAGRWPPLWCQPCRRQIVLDRRALSPLRRACANHSPSTPVVPGRAKDVDTTLELGRRPLDLVPRFVSIRVHS